MINFFCCIFFPLLLFCQICIYFCHISVHSFCLIFVIRQIFHLLFSSKFFLFVRFFFANLFVSAEQQQTNCCGSSQIFGGEQIQNDDVEQEGNERTAREGCKLCAGGRGVGSALRYLSVPGGEVATFGGGGRTGAGELNSTHNTDGRDKQTKKK